MKCQVLFSRKKSKNIMISICLLLKILLRMLSKTYTTFTHGPAAKKRGFRTYANSKDSDQPAHSRILFKKFAVRLHNIKDLV